MGIAYKDLAQQIANQYRLSVLNRTGLKLETLIAEGLKQVAQEARKEVRKKLSEKDTNNS